MKTPEIRYEHALGDGQWWGKKPPSVPGHLSQPVGGWGGEREKGEEGRERVVEVGEKGREGNGGREEGWKKEMGNKVEEEKAAFVHDYVMKQQRSSSGKTWSTFFFFFRNCSWSCQGFFLLFFFFLLKRLFLCSAPWISWTFCPVLQIWLCFSSLYFSSWIFFASCLCVFFCYTVLCCNSWFLFYISWIVPVL